MRKKQPAIADCFFHIGRKKAPLKRCFFADFWCIPFQREIPLPDENIGLFLDDPFLAVYLREGNVNWREIWRIRKFAKCCSRY